MNNNQMNNNQMNNNQMNNNQMNILFYMDSCKTCQVFINMAHKHNILKYFKLMDVGNNIQKFMNQGLKKVPTIIIKSMNIF